MKITVMSLFRDSESYLDRCLQQLSSLEEATAAEFEYYFYENDSVDNTKRILEEWISKRKGKLISESIGTPKFGSVVLSTRFLLMAYYRNTLLNYAKPISSDYTFVFDSDVIFDGSIINQYLPHMKNEVAMATPNIRQNFPSLYGDSDTSYYDCLALQDIDGNQGIVWSNNPFYFREKDRAAWFNNEVIEVRRAFGGVVLINSNVLNKCEWISQGGLEHWIFCDQVRQYGKIIVVPDIFASVHIEQKIIDEIMDNLKKY